MSDVLDFLAYFSLLIAAIYVAFVCWSVLRGKLDQDDEDAKR